VLMGMYTRPIYLTTPEQVMKQTKYPYRISLTDWNGWNEHCLGDNMTDEKVEILAKMVVLCCLFICFTYCATHGGH
jgi:hypothetical protein